MDFGGTQHLGVWLLCLMLSVCCDVILSAQMHFNETVQVGDTANLLCLLDSTGSLSVLWKDPKGDPMVSFRSEDDHRIVGAQYRGRISFPKNYGNTRSIHLEHIQPDEGGLYQCITSPQEIRTVQLTVHSYPKITELSMEPKDPYEGENVRLFCEATSNPPPTYQWFKYSQSGEKSLYSEEQEILIKRISIFDNGIYECLATNGIQPSGHQNVTINVLFDPVITLPQTKVYAPRGTDILLQCIIKANPMPPEVFWSKDEKNIVQSEKYIITNSLSKNTTQAMGLIVKNLQAGDFGSYHCQGSPDHHITLIEDNFIDVKIVRPPTNMFAQHGQKVELHCEVSGLTSMHNFIWYKLVDDKIQEQIFASNPADDTRLLIDSVPSKYKIKGHYTLVIKDVELEDAGKYTCAIDGFINESAVLTVAGDMTCLGDENVDSGTDAKLSCGMAYSGTKPDVQVVWEQGSRRLSGIEEDSEGNLLNYIKFPAFEHDNNTVFTCTFSIMKQFWRQSCQAELTVQSLVPGTSSSSCQNPVTLGFKEGSSMMLIVLAVAVGGLLILFICILTAVVCNYNNQLNYYRKRHNPDSKNGVLQHERDKLMSPPIEVMSSV